MAGRSTPRQTAAGTSKPAEEIRSCLNTFAREGGVRLCKYVDRLPLSKLFKDVLYSNSGAGYHRFAEHYSWIRNNPRFGHTLALSEYTTEKGPMITLVFDSHYPGTTSKYAVCKSIRLVINFLAKML